MYWVFFYAWNEEGSRNRNKDCMKVIEKSAYDKAIEALKLYVGVADRTQKGPTYYSIAEHTLKELGELD